MCLSCVNATYTPPIKYSQNHIGYKVFKKKLGSYFPLFHKQDGELALGVEYEDCSELVHTDYSKKRYQTGFHIFESRNDAHLYAVPFREYVDGNGMNEVVVEVEYNNIVAEGTEGEAPTVVARTMTLIREVC